MDYIAPILLIIFSVFYWASWANCRRTKNGFREDLTDCTVGQLTGETVQRKAHAGGLSAQTHKKTTVVYTYEVDGKPYTCETVVLDRFQAMPASSKVVYQKKNPQVCYLPEFEKVDEKGMQLSYLGLGLLFLVLAALTLLRLF